MEEFRVMPGDLIFYEHPDTLPEMLIEDGERLADNEPANVDGEPARYFYHVAIVLNHAWQIEALSRVKINAVRLTHAVVVRPDYPDVYKLYEALAWARTMEGRLYGWFGIFDQVLRKLSHNRVHMPVWLTNWVNNIWPYCSVLGTEIVYRAGVDVPMTFPLDPQQFYDLFKECTVYDWRRQGKG